MGNIHNEESTPLISNSLPDYSNIESQNLIQEKNEVKFTWAGITYSIKEKKKGSKGPTDKVILDGITGGVKGGEVLAVLGTSGAGKTTLLNILAGRTSEGDLNGTVLLNGNARDKSFNKLTAYVEQDDCFLGNLTVAETFAFAVQLRLPKRLSKAEKLKKADDLITQLGLSSCKNTRIGNQFVRGISGGERKRCSIGIELITNPQVLFLDEPTSGLDSFTAFHVMESIQTLARVNNRAVVCTIHQPRPNIFNLFDKLLLLSGGKTVFYGPTNSAEKFFSNLDYVINYSPADFFLDITTIDTRTPALEQSTTERNVKLVDAFNNSEYKIAALKDAEWTEADIARYQKYSTYKSGYQLSWVFETKLLFQRALLSIIREKRATIAAYMQAISMALLCGLIFLRLGYRNVDIQNRSGVLFFMVLNQTFGPLIAKVVLFHLEKALFMKERASGTYRVSSYYVSKSFAEFPVTVWTTTIFGIIGYWMCGLNPAADRFFTFLLICFVHYFTSEGLGVIVSAISPSVEVGNIIAPILIVIFMMFGGLYVNVDSIPVFLRWIKYISFISWSYKAVMINEFEGSFFWECPNGADECAMADALPNSITNGEDVLTKLNLDGDKWLCILYLFLIGLGARIIGFMALYLISKPKTKLL